MAVIPILNAGAQAPRQPATLLTDAKRLPRQGQRVLPKKKKFGRTDLPSTVLSDSLGG